MFVCLFVCLFWIRNRTFPTGSTPKGGPTEITPTTQATRHPRALSHFLFPLPLYLHPASGPYPPLSSCPERITYRVSGLSLPCPPVLHIYSNPTERNPSIHIIPHRCNYNIFPLFSIYLGVHQASFPVLPALERIKLLKSLKYLTNQHIYLTDIIIIFSSYFLLT